MTGIVLAIGLFLSCSATLSVEYMVYCCVHYPTKPYTLNPDKFILLLLLLSQSADFHDADINSPVCLLQWSKQLHLPLFLW